MNSFGEKINRKKEQAISALLSQPTLKAAAEVAGIGEKTLWRWLQNEDFQDAFMEVRRQLVQQVVSNIQRSMSNAQVLFEY